MMTAAVVAALASAFGFAMSNALQHRAAGLAVAGAGGSAALFRVLVRRPSWQLSLALGALAYLLQAVAVQNGPLIIVQPLVITGIVLALPLRAALDRRLPSLHDLRWVALTAAGIAAFVLASNPTTHGGPRAAYAVPLVAAGVIVAGVLSIRGLSARSPQQRGFLRGAAAGILFGLAAGTLKLVVLDSTHGLETVVAVSTLFGLGAWGFALNQRTYQVAPMAISMPVLNVVMLIVATTFGGTVFQEIPDYTASTVAVQVIAMVVMGIGLTRLAGPSTTVTAVADPASAQRQQGSRLADLPACDGSDGPVAALPLQRRCTSVSHVRAGVRAATPQTHVPCSTPPGRQPSTQRPSPTGPPAGATITTRHRVTARSTSLC
jgi:hypothetical protein